jgi:hypothetical protein
MPQEAVNTCTRCKARWHDQSYNAIMDCEDPYGNKWQTPAWLWSGNHPCPVCQSLYFKREMVEADDKDQHGTLLTQ